MKHLLITVHGIRTFGHWQERLEHVINEELGASDDHRLEVLNYKYGYFSVVAFLIPALRWLVVRRFRREFLRRARASRWDRIDIVAHSFGTHLVGWGLYGISRSERPQVHTIILAASVLKPAFPWLDLIGSSVHRLVNDCGIRDRVLVLNQLVVLFTGMAGRVGFAGMTGNNFRNRFFAIGHSGYFLGPQGPSDAFMQEKWVPLLVRDAPTATFADPRESSAISGLVAFFLNNTEPIKLGVYAVPVIVLIASYRYLYTAAINERDHAENARAAVVRTLSDSFFRHAQEAIANNRSAESVISLVRALRTDAANDRAFASLIWLLARRSWPKTHCNPLTHNDEITQLSFSPDGQYIATSSRDRSVRLWNSQNGSPVGAPFSHPAAVNSVSFSPDGKLLATGCEDGSARIWQVPSGRALTSPLRHPYPVTSTEFSSKGDMLLVAAGHPVIEHDVKGAQRVLVPSSGGAARVWKVADGTPITAILAHPWGVTNARFAPGGKGLATASGDALTHGEIRLWDTLTGKPQWLGKPQKQIESLQFSPDGKKILTASWDGSAVVWDAKTGERMVEVQLPGGLKDARFSVDGDRILVAGEAGSAQILNAATMDPIGDGLEHAGAIEEAEFGWDAEKIITGADDRTVSIWDTNTRKRVCEPILLNRTPHNVRFAPTGETVAVTVQNAVQVWDSGLRSMLPLPLRHNAAIYAAAFNSDGSQIVTASQYGSARIWTAHSGELVAELPHKDQVFSTTFSPDNKWIATASADKTVRVWDAQTGKAVGDPLLHDDEVFHVEFSSDGQKLLTVSGVNPSRLSNIVAESGNEHAMGRDRLVLVRPGKVTVWDRKKCVPLWTPLEFAQGVAMARFSPDGTRLVTAEKYKEARVWDATSGSVVGQPMIQECGIRSARFTPDGMRIITSGGDRTCGGRANVWDAQTGKLQLGPLELRDSVEIAVATSDGRKIITGSADGEIRLWNAASGAPETPVMKSADIISDLAVSHDGRFLATGDLDGNLILWDMKTGEQISEALPHGDGISTVQFSPDDKFILTGSLEGTARLWENVADQIPNPTRVRALCGLAEAASGYEIGETAVAVMGPNERSLKLAKALAAIASQPGDFAEWFAANLEGRKISPRSDISVRAWIDARIGERNADGLRMALQIFPNDPRLLATTGNVLAEEGSTVTVSERRKNATLAELYTRRAIELRPKDGELWAMRAITLSLLKRQSEAIQAVEMALSLSPNRADVYATKARVLVLGNKIEAARESLEKAIRIEPENVAYLYLDLVLTPDLSPERYKAKLEHMIQADSGNVQFRTMLGDLFFNDGNVSSALEHWRAARDTSPGSAPDISARLIIAEWRQGQKDTAIAEYISLRNRHPVSSDKFWSLMNLTPLEKGVLVKIDQASASF